MSTKRKCLPGNIKLKNLLLGPALLGGGHHKMPLNGSVRDPLIRGRRDKLATTFFLALARPFELRRDLFHRFYKTFA